MGHYHFTVCIIDWHIVYTREFNPTMTLILETVRETEFIHQTRQVTAALTKLYIHMINNIGAFC